LTSGLTILLTSGLTILLTSGLTSGTLWILDTLDFWV